MHDCASIFGSKSKGVLCSHDCSHSARVSLTKYDKGGKTGLLKIGGKGRNFPLVSL